MTAEIIAVTNQMGGAGKTTTSINITGAFADLGYNTLLTDMDPQGTATEGTGFEETYSKDVPSMFEILTDLDRTAELDTITRSHDEFDIIPSNIKMFKADKELIVDVPQSEARLRSAFQHLNEKYDVVVIDAPPSLDQLSDNSIIAAGQVLIPMRARRRSIRALEILGDQIDRLEKSYTTILGQGIGRLGLVVNETDHPLDNDEQYMVEWAEDFSLPAWEVRKRAAIARAWNNGVSIFAHDEDCDQEETYRDIAASLVAETGLEPTPEVEGHGE